MNKKTSDNSSWNAELRELDERREAARLMGGTDAIERQHSLGKLTARERILALLDQGSFRELGALTGKVHYDEEGNRIDFTPSNAIVGEGLIDGRRVCVSADDFTIRGGSSESSNSDKWVYIERLAYEAQKPIIRLVETAGGSVKLLDQMQATKVGGYTTWPVIPLLDSVPVVGVALGPCAGLGAFKVLTSHFSVMVRGTSQVFAAGPPVVKQAFGVEVGKEDLGGYKVHSRDSGMIDNEASDELDALAQAKRFLSYLPRNTSELPPRIVDPAESPTRSVPLLDEIIPKDKRRTYDPYKILEAVLDQGSIFEIGRYHGRSVITVLARLDGWAVGVMASDPRTVGGAMTLRAAEKIERFVKVCDTFRLPVINFVDQPGTMTGIEAERIGTLRGAMRVFEAVERSRTPWCSVLVRRCFGLAGGLHGPHYGATGSALNFRVAWPSARWGSIPIEGGVAAAYKREIADAEDSIAHREKLERHYDQLSSPFRTAERFGIPDIIAPRTTREMLANWLEDNVHSLSARRGC